MAELRDLLGTTRKYAVPIGEYLDRIGLTPARATSAGSRSPNPLADEARPSGRIIPVIR